MVHGTGFLKDKLDKVLPGHMIASRRKLEYEKKVLAKYAEICQYGFEDMKVTANLCVQLVYGAINTTQKLLAYPVLLNFQLSKYTAATY